MCAAAAMAVLAFALLCSAGAGPACAQDGEEGEPVTQQQSATRWDLAFAIAVSIGLPCLGAGYAVGKVGAAALGAASEKPELLTRGLLFVALAEGIAIYGLLMAILVLTVGF